MTAAAPLSVRLRESTREVHERVEAYAAFNRLVVARLPESPADAPPAQRARLDAARADYREVYRRFLLGALGFESAVERALEGSPLLVHLDAEGYALEGVPASALVRDDLRAEFGAGADALPAEPEPLPAPDTLAELAGLEYVRRGSRAGGAVIGAVVRHNLALTPERGASFLLRQGRGTRAHIQAFRDWADARTWSAAESDAAIARAVATFDAVLAWHARLEAAVRTPAAAR